MMIRRVLALLALLPFATPALGLSMRVVDPEFTKLGDGESSGTRFRVNLVSDYSGPVIVLFAQTEEERARGAFPGLKSRYDGVLVNGQLTLQGVHVAAERGVAAATASAPSSGVPLARFLAGFKLTLSAQPSGQSLTLPGLKTTDGK